MHGINTKRGGIKLGTSLFQSREDITALRLIREILVPARVENASTVLGILLHVDQFTSG